MSPRWHSAANQGKTPGLLLLSGYLWTEDTYVGADTAETSAKSLFCRWPQLRYWP